MEVFDSRYLVINKTLLSSCGLWPYQSSREKWSKRIFVTLVIFVIILPQAIKVYLYLGVDIDVVVEHVAVLLYTSMIYVKYLTSIFTEQKLKIVYDNVAKNWQMIKDKKEATILMQYSESGRNLTLGYIAYMIIALVLFVSLPVGPRLLDLLKPLNQSRPSIFILNGELFLDKQEHYWTIYVIDVMSVCVSVWMLSACDCIYAVVIEHSLGLFAVINFTDILELSYSSSLLILMGMNILFLTIETILVLIKMDQIFECIRFSMIMFGIVVHIFYISWPGQKLIDVSLDLFRDTYTNEWYKCSIRSQKLLEFMTMRCSRPCQLTAGGMYVMNFTNFACIVKTSMSYMTVFASFR